MNNALNDKKLKYDAPRNSEMYVFLNHMLAIAKSNPNMYFSHDIVYNELKKFTLPQSDLDRYKQPKSVEHLFTRWINDFKNVKNISVYNAENWKYWCQFTNNGYSDEYIKIYVPIDGEGIYDCVEDIFNFMAKHDMSHQSKVGRFLRNDNVVIRLHKGDEKSLRLLIEYIKTNPRIQYHLNKTNPFLPSIDGIGVMNETGISYNDKLCKAITDFINKNKYKNKVTVDEFLKYMKENIYKREVYLAFKHATDENPQYFDVNEKIDGFISENEKNNQSMLTDLQKHTLLNDTIKATYEKYGLYQVKTALYNAITKGNYNNFTNGNKKYRQQLTINVTPEEIKEFMLETMKTITNNEYFDISELVNDYCSFYLKDLLIYKLDDMCQVTLDNYGTQALAGALNKYIYFKQTNGFSRFRKDGIDKINYREYCKYFEPKTMLRTLRESLHMKGIDTSIIKNEQLIGYYSNVLSNSDYKKIIETQETSSFSR